MSNNTDSSPIKTTPISPWKKPNEIMALHRLKIKKRALQSRFNFKSNTSNTSNEIVKENFGEKKRRNPFTRSSESKRLKDDPSTSTVDEVSNDDNTLFKLLSMSSSCNVSVKPDEIPKELPNFASTLTQLSKTVEPTPEAIPGYTFMPIDWTLKSKMRIISHNKFKWSCKLRTSEEASGITGFVRCLDTTTSQSLDTSMSARCYQCCLVWQHPSLPWLQLFPRNSKTSSSNNCIYNSPDVVKALYRDWTESFRSLFQLVRARQCPYFYLCANTFTVLFRAAGISGFNETHALLTPTTRGFRQILKQEDIEFTMPLKKRRSTSNCEDLGYDTLDSASDDSPNSKSTIFRDIGNVDFVDVDEEDDENDMDDQWLKSLGVDADEIKKINYQQVRKHHAAEGTIDNSEQSLICVEGVEAQALFNFLINCKSAISITGSLAGVPPTLLAPVSFLGATLQSLKVRESKVTVDEGEYYSMEVCGPILPHTVHLLAALLLNPDDEYSATFANITNTTSFSKVNVKNKDDHVTSDKEDASVLFGQENLTDCGLPSKLIKHFCSPDPQHIQIVESLKFTGKEQLYSWK